jgi:hypothetical protein
VVSGASYAVKWREPGGLVSVGRLELSDEALLLQGRDLEGGVVHRSIELGDLSGVRLGRVAEERLDGQNALVVDGPDGAILVSSVVVHAGVLRELVDRLATLTSDPPRTSLLILPLKKGMAERARELAASGPPFDPDTAGLTRHQLLLTDEEAIFVVEAASGTALRGLLGRVDIWAAAAAWTDLLSGPPRLAEVVYAWERRHGPVAVGLGL